MKKYVMYYYAGKYHFNKPSGEKGVTFRAVTKTRGQIIRLHKKNKCGPSVGAAGMRKHIIGIF